MSRYSSANPTLSRHRVGLKGFAYRGINAILADFNLRVEVICQDFDARLDQPAQVERMFSGIGTIADRWLAEQKLFPVRSRFDSAQVICDFYHQYLSSPFRAVGGGSRFNNLVWLHLIARALQPGLVIDSGTFRGASAWAFASSGAKVYSFDVDLSHVARRDDRVVYLEHDWTAFDWKGVGVDLSNALIYFDDHLDQVRRLIESSERGIRVAIFDDDFPITSFAAMAHAGHALPKIEFALDPEMSKYEKLSWIDCSRHFVFSINHAYLDRGRALIAGTERLPDTSLITGIQQTPYRIVRIDEKS